MEEVLYNACLRYFTTLSHYGYKDIEDIKKLLFYIYIEELVKNPSVLISEEDYRHIENAMYCIYGTSCLIPYPNYCGGSKDLHFGDFAEYSEFDADANSPLGLLRRVENLEQQNYVLEGDALYSLENNLV